MTKPACAGYPIIFSIFIIQGVHEHGWPPFFGKLWQRNYYERIIRDEAELQRTHEYIVQNPLRWNSAM